MLTLVLKIRVFVDQENVMDGEAITGFGRTDGAVAANSKSRE